MPPAPAITIHQLRTAHSANLKAWRAARKAEEDALLKAELTLYAELRAEGWTWAELRDLAERRRRGFPRCVKDEMRLNATCRRMGKGFGIEFAKTRMHAPGTIWKALELHEAGYDTEQIAKRLGYKNRASASHAVRQAREQREERQSSGGTP